VPCDTWKPDVFLWLRAQRFNQEAKRIQAEPTACAKALRKEGQWRSPVLTDATQSPGAQRKRAKCGPRRGHCPPGPRIPLPLTFNKASPRNSEWAPQRDDSPPGLGRCCNQAGAGVGGDLHGREVRGHLHSTHKGREKKRAEFAARRNQGQSSFDVRSKKRGHPEESFAVTG